MLIIAIIGPKMKFLDLGSRFFQKDINANSEINETIMLTILHDSCLERIITPEIMNQNTSSQGKKDKYPLLEGSFKRKQCPPGFENRNTWIAKKQY